MVKMIVCMKQVPMAAELPWDPKTRTLRRDLADGMMNPACKHALEAALTVKHDQGGHVSAIEIFCPDFDLILTGCHTTDSETAQVGPQLAEELGIPGIAYVDEMAVTDGHIRVRRISDDFLETLETDLPCLLTVNIGHYAPRYVPLSGLQEAFGEVNILAVSAADLGIDPAFIGVRGSPTRILDVFAPRAEKENIVLTGAPKKIVEELFERFDAKIGGIIKKDIKWEGRG
jgi:electron transfer flavoprotein beta subunit